MNVTRFLDFLFLFYRYDFVVGLLQGFMINAHESGSNFPGVGTFRRDLTKQSPGNAGILPGLCICKNQYPRYSPALAGTWLQITGALLKQLLT